MPGIEVPAVFPFEGLNRRLGVDFSSPAIRKRRENRLHPDESQNSPFRELPVAWPSSQVAAARSRVRYTSGTAQVASQAPSGSMRKARIHV